MGPKVEYLLNPATKKPEVFIDGRPMREYDFSYSAVFGYIGFKYLFADAARWVTSLFSAMRRR